MTVAAMLEVSELEAGYRGVPIVRGVSLRVDEGEVVALFGPNGAGKTTTLLAVSGVLAPMAGQISIAGAPLKVGKAHLAARGGLAHVPEDRSLFSQLTVADNLRLGAHSRRCDVEESVKYFPALQPLLGRRAGLLSGGEQQMLAIARALTSEPRVLMVDEMSLGLAPIIVRNLMRLLRDIATHSGIAVLFVEQHVHLALAVSDRAYVMNRGRIVFDGACSDLVGRRELLEASYLGAVDQRPSSNNPDAAPPFSGPTKDFGDQRG